MLIDWFTFTAQLINFIVLIWLMKRYLYEPVLNALDERERLIAGQINDAEVKEKEAQEERDTYQKKNEEFEQKRSELLNDAKAEAKAKRDELVKQVRQESEELRERFKRSLTSERQQVQGQIMKRATSEVFAITRKTLSDLANSSLEERIIEVFMDRVHSQNSSEKGKMKKAFGTSPQTIKVMSSLEISPELQTKLKDSLAEFTPADTRFEFIQSADLTNGLELSSNDYKISWSIDEYLATLEAGIMDSIQHTSA